MPLNTNIPLSIQTEQINPNALTEIQAARTGAVQNQQAQEMNEQQIMAQKVKNLDARQQQRLKSSIIGAAQLAPLLETDNIEGARSFLERRRQELGKQISEGMNVDTAETDDALRLLQEDPEQLKQLATQSVQLGKQLGFLKDPNASKTNPAAVVIANEIQKAREVGDTQRVNDLLLASKALEKGQTLDEQGNITNISGFTAAAAETEKAKESGKQQAKLELAPKVAEAVEASKVVGKEQGIAKSELDTRIASIPRLKVIADELSELGKVATFTKAGQAADAARRQLGLPVGEGAVARTDYIAKIDNEILPLLRQTFGAAFTAAEGQSLKATLGDPDLSPEEKDAVLRSFIAAKIGTIESLQKQVGGESGTLIDFNDLPD